ncbi:MAG: flagellar hook-length control protein FliK [Planctomycetaceae bacterium]|jgi:hypothetical protein|nr:flagellar hook-length control protein FliK [Planctomycetaceae bacterium]
MSIDITTNNRNNSLAEQGQSTETPNPETLKSVFVTAMQNSLTNRTFRSHTSIADINVSIQRSAADQKEQQNKDQYKSLQQSERRDFTKEDKRTLNQSEIRQEQLSNDYVRKVERHENQQTEYNEKNEHRDLMTNPSTNPTATPFGETVSLFPASTAISTVPTISVSAALSTTLPVLSEFPNRQFPVPQQESVSVPITPGMIPPSFLIAGSNPISVATSPEVQPAALTTSAAPVAALDAVSVMTIFTASGRFGIRKEETEEKNVIEKKKEKEKTKEKKGMIPLFVPGFVEITPPVAYKNPPTHTLSDTEMESESNNNSVKKSVQKIAGENGQELESKLEKPESEQESESDENRTKTPLEKWFREDQPVENTVANSNEPEPFDQLQFIQRVAAACRSAANQHGTIRIKLHLDQLGTLTLRITSKSNKLAIRFEVTSFSAVRRLRDTLDELHTTLAEQNILLEHTEIDVI